MYNNKFVATVKADGKVLRELGDTVFIPFGSEYSLYLKNLNTVRALVKVTIDGEDIGADLVVRPNGEMDVERFVKDLNKGNRFKFIERTSSIEQHRGVGSTDGLVRIEFSFEKPYVPPVYTPRPSPWISASGFNINGALRSVDYSKGETMKATAALATDLYCATNGIGTSSFECHLGAATMDSFSDVGITVPGSVSDQKFQTVSSFPVEAQSHVIVLQLKGESGYNKVTEPVTVKTKPKCVTCGKVNKATSKFCSNCGTSLELV